MRKRSQTMPVLRWTVEAATKERKIFPKEKCGKSIKVYGRVKERAAPKQVGKSVWDIKQKEKRWWWGSL